MDINNPDDQPFMLTPAQIERALDELVPLVAPEGDEGVTRFLIQQVAEGSSAAQFAAFVKKMLSSSAA